MKKLLILPVILIFLPSSLFILGNLVKTKKISCISQKGKCDENLESKINNLHNESILSTNNSLNEFLKTDSNILAYSISFEPVNSFKVNVIERIPVVAFQLKNGQFALVDKEGVIINEVKDSSLPKIITYYNLSKEELIFVTNLMNSLYTFYNVEKGVISANGLEIDNIRTKNVLFPMSGDIDVLLGSLNLILSRLPSVKEASTIVTIDLRFKNPVLR